MNKPVRAETGVPWDRDRFASAMSDGTPELLDWLRARAERRASPRFSRWAWEWVREDFFSELSMQLLVTVRKPEFDLRTSVETYVDTCIANLCSAWFRRIARLRGATPMAILGAGEIPTVSPTAEHVAMALDLRRALLALEPPQRRLLVEKYVNGLSLQEIGAMMNIPAATVQSRLHASREKLRTIFHGLERSPTATKPRTPALSERKTRGEG